MINLELLSIDWINSVSQKQHNADTILVEKAIRALLLVEGLAKQKVPFIFKGGTALMLLMNSTKRLSIDVDIILPVIPADWEEILQTVSRQQGFTHHKKQDRNTQTNIPKTHYKFFYTPIHRSFSAEESILLDVLNEHINYQNVIQIPIDSLFVPVVSDPILVSVPCLEDILADKLTAFAPNTTGIPYFKENVNMSMEIIKQLYDIGNLCDVVEDIEMIRTTFRKFATTEIFYRNLDSSNEDDVLEDIYQTALCLSLRGADGKGDFEKLQTGIHRVVRFIFSESYHLDKAIIHASKAAYLSILIKSDKNRIEKYGDPGELTAWTIAAPMNTKLNRLKKSNPEAFYYWYKCSELLGTSKLN